MTTEYLNNANFEGMILKFQKTKKELNRHRMFVEDIRGAQLRTAGRKYKKPEAWTATEKKHSAINAVYRTQQDELADVFYILCKNLVRYARFNFIDEDDALQEGVMTCLEKIDRFDIRRGSKAFNFFTTLCINTWRQLYRNAKKYNELKKKYLDHLEFKVEQYISKNVKKNGYRRQAIFGD